MRNFHIFAIPTSSVQDFLFHILMSTVLTALLILAILLGVNILFQILYFSDLELPFEMEIKTVLFLLLNTYIWFVETMFLFINNTYNDCFKFFVF